MVIAHCLLFLLSQGYPDSDAMRRRNTLCPYFKYCQCIPKTSEVYYYSRKRRGKQYFRKAHGKELPHEVSWKNQNTEGSVSAEIEFVAPVGSAQVKAIFEDSVGCLEKTLPINVVGRPTLKMQLPPERLAAGLTVGEKVSFPLLFDNMTESDFKVTVSYADGKLVPFDILAQSDGSCHVEFTPTRDGDLSLKLEMIGAAAELSGKSEVKPVNFKVRAKPFIGFTATNEAVANFPATCAFSLIKLTS